MIRLTIENPSDHDYDELQAVISYLQQIAGMDRTATAPNPVGAEAKVSREDFAVVPNSTVAAAAELDEMLTAHRPAEIAHTNESEPSARLSAGVELDANGLPWDARIHAGNRAKIADGSWRRRRGVEAELVNTVETELRQLMSQPGAEQLSDPARPMTAVESSEYVAFPSEVPPPPPPAPPAPAEIGPNDVFQRLLELRDGPAGFTDEQLQMALGAVGFKAVNDVFKRPDQAGQLLDTINGLAGAG